jgi:hypothetical protein
VTIEPSRGRVVACVYERTAQCTGQQYIWTVGGGRGSGQEIHCTSGSLFPFRNYILVSINGTNSPFPTMLQILRSKAMIRPSFVLLKCKTVRRWQIGKCLNILYRQATWPRCLSALNERFAASGLFKGDKCMYGNLNAIGSDAVNCSHTLVGLTTAHPLLFRAATFSNVYTRTPQAIETLTRGAYTLHLPLYFSQQTLSRKHVPRIMGRNELESQCRAE